MIFKNEEDNKGTSDDKKILVIGEDKFDVNELLNDKEVKFDLEIKK